MKITLYDYKGQRQILLIYLGESDGFIIGVESCDIPAGEKQILKGLLNKNPSIPLKSLLLYVKKHCPTAYSKGYRRINSDHLRSLKSYDI